MTKLFFKCCVLLTALTIALSADAASNRAKNKRHNQVQKPAPVAVYTAENPLLKTDSHLISQRRYFMDARKAIRQGDINQALYIKRNFLKDYPLAIWLDYWMLSTDPQVSKFNDVIKFISTDDHKELSSFLKEKYIAYLQKEGQFKKSLQLIGEKPYDDNTIMTPYMEGRQCRYYEALWHLNKADVTAQAFANKMYLQLRPYSNVCSGLIYMWNQNGYLKDKVKLEKFERAYITRNYNDTTRNLSYQLSDTKFSARVARSMKYYDSPENILKLEPNGSDEQRRVAVLAFKRFANLKPEDASLYFDNFAKNFKISETERHEIVQLISRGFLGRSSTLEQVEWVDRHLPAVTWTEELKIMRMRRAIWFRQWNQVYSLYDQLSENSKNEINWRYWKARSATEIGKKQEGRALMIKVSEDRSFFGFLAAQELGRELPFNHEHLSSHAHWPETAAKNKAAVRFFELRALDDNNASIEWREVAKYGTNDEAMLMAEWALNSGNAAYAIDSVIAGKRWDALDYRFPKPYFNLYKKFSSSTSVPISFLYGISRQESMLNPTIKSPVGAVGLMQLMPATAKLVSKQNHWKYSGPKDLVIPENNIRLGSAYLRDMLAKFDNNRVLAAAAYNAGPGRIKIWKSSDGLKRDTAQFIENIPFTETRIYVQNVLLYDAIYKKLLSGKGNLLLKPGEKSYKY